LVAVARSLGFEHGIAVVCREERWEKWDGGGAWLVGSLSLLTKAFYALWGSFGRWLFEFL